MTDWFRSWHGAPTDPKWLVIARKADVSPAVVSAIVWALFDYASQHVERGTVEGFDVETYAVWSGLSESDVEAVIGALEAKGVIVDGRLTNWEKRQPRREDDSRERVRAHRDRKRDAQPVTHGNADVTHGNADVTHGNAPDAEERRTEQRRTERQPTRAGARETAATSGSVDAVVPEMVEILFTAAFVPDGRDDVEAKVRRGFALVPDFDPVDGPYLAERFAGWRKYKHDPPDDWFQSWISWVQDEARDTAQPRAPALVAAGIEDDRPHPEREIFIPYDQRPNFRA